MTTHVAIFNLRLVSGLEMLKGIFREGGPVGASGCWCGFCGGGGFGFRVGQGDTEQGGVEFG